MSQFYVLSFKVIHKKQQLEKNGLGQGNNQVMHTRTK